MLLLLLLLPAQRTNTQKTGVQHDGSVPDFSMFLASSCLGVSFCPSCQGVRSQIEDVRAGMLENVDKVLERGEKIEVRHFCRRKMIRSST